MMTDRFGQPLKPKSSNSRIKYDTDRLFSIVATNMKKRCIIYYIVFAIVVYFLLGSTPIFDHRNWILPPHEELKVLCCSKEIEIKNQSTYDVGNFTPSQYIRITDITRQVVCGKFVSLDQETLPMQFTYYQRFTESITQNEMNQFNPNLLTKEYEKFPLNTRYIAWYYGIVYDMHYSYGNIEIATVTSVLDQHRMSGEPIEIDDSLSNVTYMLLELGKGIIIFLCLSAVFIIHISQRLVKSNY